MSDLTQIVKRFPEREYAIYKLAKSNDQFLELCNTYDDCVQMNVKPGEKNDEDHRKKEYLENSIELEAMILSYLGT
jgi:hypothetical protein